MNEKLLLEELKLYLRIDHTDEDGLLNGLLSSATGYLKNAGCVVTEGELYDLAIKILVSHWYENREVVGKADKLAYSLDSIITQLKYCEVQS